MWFVPEKILKELGRTLPPQRFNSSGKCIGNFRFSKNTSALMSIAFTLSLRENVDVLPVFFRDCDGSCSDSKKRWNEIRDSIINVRYGNSKSFFVCPMIPNPKSEAWILCALKEKYHPKACNNLEKDLSGNDNSPNSAKKILEEILGEPATRTLLNSLFQNGQINPENINMDSLLMFQKDIKKINYGLPCIKKFPKSLINRFKQYSSPFIS